MADDIKGLEKELIEAQQLDIQIRGENSTIQKIGNAYAVIPELYTNKKLLEKMIKEIKEATKQYMIKNNIKGRLLSKNALNKFIEKSERLDLVQKNLNRIEKLSEQQAEARLLIEFAELEKEASRLASDITISKLRLRNGNLSAKDTLKQLTLAGKDQNGVVQGFIKRAKSIAAGAARREKAAGKLDNYLGEYSKDTPYQWIAINSKPCPDCQARAGMTMPYNEWVSTLGIPGSGRTICGIYCMCDLMPLPLAEKRFPVVKQFAWNSKDLVLTTGMEERKMKAKKYQPKGN